MKSCVFKTNFSLFSSFSRQPRHPYLRQLPRDVLRSGGYDRAQEVLLQAEVHLQVRHEPRQRRGVRKRRGLGGLGGLNSLERGDDSISRFVKVSKHLIFIRDHLFPVRAFDWSTRAEHSCLLERWAKATKNLLFSLSHTPKCCCKKERESPLLPSPMQRHS